MATRIGVDIGGTFTDLICYDDDSGDILVEKVPTTPASPETGCVEAVKKAVPPDLLNKSEYFLHGTTVGLNALLERKGSVVGLLATEGFRDVLEIRKGDRGDWYNLFWVPQAPLVPRRLRLPVRERMRSNGEVLTAMEGDDVLKALDIFEREGVNAIAVCFLNAYANPAHELEVKRILEDEGFTGAISLSHQVSGEYRDYERTSTTVIDAFVRGRLSHYMEHIETNLKEIGFNGTCLITRSGSGSMVFSEAESRPFETIMSGPVAGAEGSAELSRSLGLGDLITADVGGTSFDTALITNGRPKLLYQGSVIGMPLQTPWVDVRSIGAGGGSIAYVDVGGLLQVGPQSAGADPGPACYARGGTEATVTDAAFYLGMLGEGELASGVMLDMERSEAALRPLAGKLNYNLQQTARGIIKIVGASMANAIREITIEQGIDPRSLKLLAFGGAGPMMGTQLARELGIDTIIIPPVAGNFSAWGLLASDLLQSAARTRQMVLDDQAIEQTNQVLQELYNVLQQRTGARNNGEGVLREVGLDMRYGGQEHTITVAPAALEGRINENAEAITQRFNKAYLQTYGVELDSNIEIVSIRAAVRQPLSRRKDFLMPKVGSGDQRTASIKAYSFVGDTTVDFTTCNRAALVTGNVYQGPAIIYEPTTTTYVDDGFTFQVISGDCLQLTRVEN